MKISDSRLDRNSSTSNYLSPFIVEKKSPSRKISQGVYMMYEISEGVYTMYGVNGGVFPMYGIKGIVALQPKAVFTMCETKVAM